MTHHESKRTNRETHDNRLIAYLWQNRRLGIAVSLFLGTLVLLYGLGLYTPAYDARALVLIRDSAITARYVTQDTAEPRTTSSALSNSVLNTMALLKTESVGNGLWRYFHTYHPDELRKRGIRTHNDWQEFFGDGKSMILAKNSPGTDVIAVSFKWTDPVLAKTALEEVLTTFQTSSRQLNQSEQRERRQYLEKRMDDVRRHLQDVREQIRQYKTRHHSVNVLGDIENQVRIKRDVETALENMRAEAAAHQGEVSQYQRMLGLSTSSAIKASALGGNPTLAKLYETLYEARQQHGQLRVRYTPKHPKIKALTEQIAQTERDIAREAERVGIRMSSASVSGLAIVDAPRTTAIAGMMTAKAQAASFHRKAAVLAAYLHRLEAESKTLPQIERDIANLTDEASMLSDSLKTLQKKALEANIQEMQTLSNVFIIDPPHVSHKPGFPSRKQFIFIGWLLSLATGVAAIFIKRKWEFPGTVETPLMMSDSSPTDMHAKVR